MRGIKSKFIQSAYLSYVRSRTESGLLPASPMLKEVDWDGIESVQRRCTRTVLGHPPVSFAGDQSPSYPERLAELGIVSLKERTKARFEKFILKTEFEQRFEQFYGLKPTPKYNLKNPQPYVVPMGKTDRLKFAPFTEGARILNRQTSTRTERLKSRHLPSNAKETAESQMDILDGDDAADQENH